MLTKLLRSRKNRKESQRRSATKRSNRRHLRTELLEDRRLLAVGDLARILHPLILLAL